MSDDVFVAKFGFRDQEIARFLLNRGLKSAFRAFSD